LTRRETRSTRRRGDEDGGNDAKANQDDKRKEDGQNGSTCRNPVALPDAHDDEDDLIEASDEKPDQRTIPKRYAPKE